MEGVRVLEVSHAVAGPGATQILSDYGAEVIKIERPGSGDIFRNTPGMGPSMFLAINRGKKSVTLDLKSKTGLDLFYRLVNISDIVVENLGPGVAEDLGLTFQKVRRSNPRAIYCKIESFGKGPYEKIPAFDPVLQAAAGIMSTTGFPPDKYARAGISVVDMAAGFHAASGILALLHRRESTGKGGELSVSLFDAASYFMSYWIALYDLTGRDTIPLGAAHVFGAPYNLFETRDGFVYIAIAGEKTWKSFCEAMGFADLLMIRRYATNSDRVLYKKSLENEVAKRLRKLTACDVVRKLRTSGVPCSKMNTVKSLLKDPHFLGAGTLKPYSYSGKKFRTVVNPAKIDGQRIFNRNSPQQLGSSTKTVLTNLLDLDDKDISELKRTGVISY